MTPAAGVLSEPPEQGLPIVDGNFVVARMGIGERLGNALRDYFGTFGAVAVVLVPFRSVLAPERGRRLNRKPLICLRFNGRSDRI